MYESINIKKIKKINTYRFYKIFINYMYGSSNTFMMELTFFNNTNFFPVHYHDNIVIVKSLRL